VAELLLTFGLSYLMLELVQLVWGRGPMDYRVPLQLDGPLFSLFGVPFPKYRAFMMGVSVLMLMAIWQLLRRARIGLIIQAALTHPDMVQALGHNLPRILMWVFGGGCALAGLAGVIAGNAYVTEPAMALSMGALVFVVLVLGGIGSLVGAFIASILLGVLQTLAVGWGLAMAPMLPYLLMVLILVFRPRGLLGRRGV
jgi:branched-chain amino acid transport system permease protein